MQVCGLAGPQLPPLHKAGISPGPRPWDAGRPMTTNPCGRDHVSQRSVLWSIFFHYLLAMETEEGAN